MSDIVVLAHGLGKRYRISQGSRARYGTLRDRIADALARRVRGLAAEPEGSPGGRTWAAHGESEDGHIWALKDVSLSVRCGEVLGIIGRNGAGKTTLLKVLSRITEPSQGYAEISGRVGSLLEVGTGFHPELTGRENIYLSGAILGMKRREIARKFDEIVAFAEVPRFIDTPVKFYSSGMFVRLGFAVAAHLEPEVLLVDEVLAVGDASFQHKCLGKMGEVARAGRTVLFVSHDMTSISMLCSSAILLAGGRIQSAGSAEEVVARYLREKSDREHAAWDLAEAPGDEGVRIVDVELSAGEWDAGEPIRIDRPLEVTITFVVLNQSQRLNPVLRLKDARGLVVFSSANYADPVWGSKEYETGRYAAKCIIPRDILNCGLYAVDAMVIKDARYCRAWAEDAISFTAHDTGEGRGDYLGEWTGVVRPPCQWELAHVD